MSGEEVPEGGAQKTSSEEVMVSIEFLRGVVQEQGGLPPTDNREFYETVNLLVKNYGMSYREVAEALGVDANQLRWRTRRAIKKVVEEVAKPKEPRKSSRKRRKEEDIAEEVVEKTAAEESTYEAEAIPGAVIRHIYNKVVAEMRPRVDQAIIAEIDTLFKTAMEFRNNHYAWCEEQGKDPVQCLNEAFIFYRKYRDYVGELERKLSDYKNLLKLLLSADYEFLSKLATAETMKYLIVKGIRKGYVPPDKIDAVLTSVENYIRRRLFTGV